MRFLQEARAKVETGKGRRGRGRGRGGGRGRGRAGQPSEPDAKVKGKPKAKAKTAGGEDSLAVADPKAKAKAKASTKRAAKAKASAHSDPVRRRLNFDSPIRGPIFNTPRRRGGEGKGNGKGKKRPRTEPQPEPEVVEKSWYLQHHEAELPATFARRARPTGLAALERYARVALVFRDQLEESVPGKKTKAEAGFHDMEYVYIYI